MIVSWSCRVIAAAILLQTLFFKFTGSEESVYIFTKVGLEPWGRYVSGVVELIAAILLLTPLFGWIGGLVAMGVMAGAIFSHLTKLGIVVKNDGGLLFGLAVVVFICSSVVLFLHRHQIPFISHFLKPQNA